MTTKPDCERVRLAMMAAFDKEAGPAPSSDQQHVSECASCQQWFEQLQVMAGQLQGLPYPSAERDLWGDVDRQIRHVGRSEDFGRWLWPIAAGVLAWRAFQLFVDLPVAMVHPLVPLAALAATIWLVTGDALAIQTSAPELQKRGA